MANITGRPVRQEVKRILTGLHSHDHAFEDNLGEYGVPTRCVFEITGAQGIGKSTYMFSLAGMVAQHLKRNITLVDFEGQNESTLSTCLDLSGFTGELEWKTYEWSDGEKKSKKSAGSMTSDEELIAYSTRKCYETDPNIIMLDSLAAYTPTTIHEGDVNDANIGTAAKGIKTWLRQTLKPVLGNPSPNLVFFTNHKYPIIGAFKPGPNAPTPMKSAGGEAVGYLATQSVSLKKLYGYAHPETGGYVLEGKIDKNRDGFGIESKRSFYVYIQAGEGINKNLTAVVDCIMYELAESSSTGMSETGTITMDGVKYKVRDLIAQRHEDNLFAPFYNSLRGQGSIKETSGVIGG